MKADNTTPRPWLAHGCVIESASRCVTVTRGGIARADWQDDCPDARLIVRAVNAHDAMREALADALELLTDPDADACSPETQRDADEVTARIQSALALADKE